MESVSSKAKARYRMNSNTEEIVKFNLFSGNVCFGTVRLMASCWYLQKMTVIRD